VVAEPLPLFRLVRCYSLYSTTSVCRMHRLHDKSKILKNASIGVSAKEKATIPQSVAETLSFLY
jgi:hypothetical protein